MSRKTKPPRSTPPRSVSSQQHCSVGDAPRVGRPLSLICGACGASGRYNVGTVTLDPTVAESPEQDTIAEGVGFTGYFRCRKCDAGGPWELPVDTLMRVTGLTILALSGKEDVPLVYGSAATFDGYTFRYATETEVHLKQLIDHEPERAFLWVRLGNFYSHCGQSKLAKKAYNRALELDRKDIEAHSMLGQLFVEEGRPLDAVPCFHAVLKHARDAQQVDKKLRRNLVRGAIESLLEAHAESQGEINLLPTMDPAELEKRGNEPSVVELREFDLASEEGINDLCDVFLPESHDSVGGLFRRIRSRMAKARANAAYSPDDWPTMPIRREALVVGRNDSCPCGSGRKYKKCCGR
ncbi:MAG: SEC-C domain-containing protein [Phycisphaerales bacterium]|nr:MAG: SEC-C domain-containing protein [Phycisphaerales bacterium]